MAQTMALFLEREYIMVVDDSITQALNRIAENQEELNDTLKRILNLSLIHI